MSAGAQTTISSNFNITFVVVMVFDLRNQPKLFFYRFNSYVYTYIECTVFTWTFFSNTFRYKPYGYHQRLNCKNNIKRNMKL